MGDDLLPRETGGMRATKICGAGDVLLSPGKVSDLTLPLVDVADGYRAMDSATAIKVLLQP